MTDKDLFILHKHYHGCRWPGDTRSQSISGHRVDVFLAEYSSVSTRRAESVCPPLSFYDYQTIQHQAILKLLKFKINSLWPSDAIWRHRSGSAWSPVMACCLMAPSHYLNQCWLVSEESCGMHQRAISHWVPQLLICMMRLKKILLKKITATYPRDWWVNFWKFLNSHWYLLWHIMTYFTGWLCGDTIS